MKQRINSRWGYLWLIASLTAIIVATISPFNFILPKNPLWVVITDGFIFGSNIKDYWQNILLFIPFGFGLGMILLGNKLTSSKILLFCFLTSCGLSTTVELTQLFLPSRVSNFTDIIYNTIGGGLGSWLYLQAKPITHFMSLAIAGNYRQLSYKSIFWATGGYYSLISLAVLVLLTSNNLNNWKANYYLALGNEVTGSRPWSGSLQSLYVSDRALPPSQVAQVFEETKDFFAQDPHLVTAIVSEEQATTIKDRQGRLPNFLRQQESQIEPPTKPKATKPQPINPHPPEYYQRAIKLSRQSWFKTQSPAKSLVNRLKTSDRFTLSLTVATHHLQQGGPARIVAISQNIFSQNLVIAQKQDSLYFRLRTPITGRNPVDPAFLIPRVFNDFDFHQILITFGNNTLTFYIDRPQNRYSYTFRPDVNFAIFIPWTNREWNVKLGNFSTLKYQLLFYTIVFLPLIWIITTIWFKTNGQGGGSNHRSP